MIYDLITILRRYLIEPELKNKKYLFRADKLKTAKLVTN